MESNQNVMNKTCKEFIVQTETDSYDLEASVRIIGKDILIAVWGGDNGIAVLFWGNYPLLTCVFQD